MKKVFLPKREDCLEYIREVRWHGVVRCLFCGSSDIWIDGTTSKGARNLTLPFNLFHTNKTAMA